MRKEITIGDENVAVVANAATPFIYSKIFNDDLLRGMQKDPEDVSRFIRLAFTMAKQADTSSAELMQGKVTEDDFVSWLEKYEFMDICDATTEILSVYQASKKGSSVPKTKAD